MRIHYLQHVPFEDLGCIRPWAEKSGHSITKTPLYQTTALPKPSEFDALIILGGPMGVYDESKYSWMTAEKKFIEMTLRHQKPMLGICLGSQLIANVLGARVYPHTHKEIGWWKINALKPAQTSSWASPLGESFEVFQWHGDTFDLPKGSTHLFSSEACPHQAFEYGGFAIALQFHMESTQESIELLLKNCPEDIPEKLGPYIQSPELILSNLHFLPKINQRAFALLEHLEKLSKVSTF